MAFFTEILSSLRALFTWWFAVAPWERAVRLKWGKYEELLGPGIHMRVPIRDRIYRQSVRLRSTETIGQNLTTRDGKIVTLAFVIEWAIGDLLKIFTTITQPEKTVATRVKAVMADEVANRAVTDIDPLDLAKVVTDRMKELDWGLKDVQVRITEFIIAARTYRLIQGGHGFTELDFNVRWDDDMFTATARSMR